MMSMAGRLLLPCQCQSTWCHSEGIAWTAIAPDPLCIDPAVLYCLSSLKSVQSKVRFRSDCLYYTSIAMSVVFCYGYFWTRLETAAQSEIANKANGHIFANNIKELTVGSIRLCFPLHALVLHIAWHVADLAAASQEQSS